MACFQCVQCDVPFGPGQEVLLGHDESLYCMEHHAVLCGNTCSACCQPLVSEYRIAQEAKFHPQCFVCFTCGDELVNEFFEMGDAVFCRRDFELVCLPRCGGCKHGIEGKFASALGEHWHPGCFACDECREPLMTDETFKFRTADGAVFCPPCYAEKHSSKCSGCGFALSGRFLRYNELLWHEECLVCNTCSAPLADQVAYTHGKNAYCKDHIAEQLMAGEGCPDGNQPVTTNKIVAGAHGDAVLAKDGQLRNAQVGEAMAAAVKFAHGTYDTLSQTIPITDTSLSSASYAAKFSSQFTCELSGFSVSFEFEEYAPAVFRDIRQMFGVSTPDFLQSMSDKPLTGGSIGEGKSGQIFYFSWDKRFVIKTLTLAERQFLVRCLKDYHNHLQGNTETTLLPRFYALFKVKFPKEYPMRVVVMHNVFLTPDPTIRIQEQYDLKGVLDPKKRRVTDKQRAAGVTTLKDLNLTEPIRLGRLAQLFNTTLRLDCRFLMDHGMMDYSLLLGVCKSPPDSDPACSRLFAWQKEFGGVLASNPRTLYYLGIIDILQEYNLKKMMEHAYKTSLTSLSGKDPSHVSACQAAVYARRFSAFLTAKVADS
mmetsp:Transcript_39923/g.89578  ORF Transcript_39923/g.89578 Transcript_39923/m.89578 type:complete len:596 (+) Transcript_39923:590-2377(+)